MIAFLTCLALSAALLGALYRLIVGPTLHDRALGAYGALLTATLQVAALAALDGRAAWIDGAVALAFADFIVAVATMKAFRTRSLQTALARRGRPEAGL
jgi:multisubunit Na+/H+ antiporter MnhF subunit